MSHQMTHQEMDLYCGVSPERLAAKLIEVRERGNTAVVSTPTTLQLDLDSDEAFFEAKKRIEKFRRQLGLIDGYSTISKSGNYHIYLELAAPMRLTDRIFWQCALGSDPVREALAHMWVQLGFTGDPLFLEETPQAVPSAIPPFHVDPYFRVVPFRHLPANTGTDISF